MKDDIKSSLFTRKKKFFILGAIITIAIIGVGIIGFKNYSTPELSLTPPNKEITANSKDEIVIPVVLSNIPKDEHPASNITIDFDENKLEFVELAEGTMEVYNDYDKENNKEAKFKIPKWSYNTDFANEEGKVKAMYLDTTAGKNAYNEFGFKKNSKDIVFKLVFKLRSSANEGDKLTINIEDAMFATVNGEEDKSILATKKGYSKLNTKELNIKIK